MRAKLEALNNQDNGSGVDNSDKFWKAPLGKSTIRIVPSAYDLDNPFTELLFHSSKVFKYAPLSLSNFGAQDPIEEFIKKLRETSDKDNWSLSGKISPKSRYFCPIIVRGEEEKGVRLWNIGPTIYKALLSLAADEEIGDFTDVTSGTDMVVEKTAPKTPGAFPEITVRAKRNSSALSDDPKKVEEWLKAENQPKAIECFRKPDYDYIKKNLQAYLAGKPVDEQSVKSEETSEEKPQTVPVSVEEKKKTSFEVSKPKASQSTSKKFNDLFGDEDSDEKGLFDDEE